MIEYIIISILSFSIGYLFKGALVKDNAQIYKNHLDVLNWLKSDLSQEENVKLTKNYDKSKIALLKLIIGRLKRHIN